MMTKTESDSASPPSIRSPAAALFYGRARNPLVRAVPDERYAGMWRLPWPEIVNDHDRVKLAADRAEASARA